MSASADRTAPSWIDRHWHGDTLPSRLLLPLSWIYCVLMALRRMAFRVGLRRRMHIGVPVIVVGNVTVGGTGKTPLVLWLAHQLATAGYRPGIVTRGYRGAAHSWPRRVTADSDPVEVGDEPVVLARRAHCPVVADPDRVRGASLLAHEARCNVVISDDGLQHLRLARDIEIVVIDGVRRFGNGRCLPAGPLREPAARARRADVVLVHGEAGAGEWGMRLNPTGLRSLVGDEAAAPDTLRHTRVHAVAGIGFPERFFSALERLGLTIIRHPYPDHHRFQPVDVRFDDSLPVIMTEKDAVKCRRWIEPGEPYWYLAVDAEPDPRLGPWLTQRLAEIARG